ncbi:MAG: YaeQ family protein [Ghiorsea sp.]|nr:YaeQ family protein [Ghiorsea sp.]
MAIKSTIYKADVQVSNMDTYYFEGHSLTLAKHPSEHESRMMIRLLAFALNAHEYMTFTKGLGAEDEPDLWQKSLSDEVEVWIDLGQPDEKRIRKACGRAKQVIIYTYNYRSALTWWDQVKNKLSRFDNLKVYALTDEAVSAMSEMAKRNVQLQYMIQDSEIMVSDGQASTTFELTKLTS